MRTGDTDGIDELRSTPAGMARAAHARRVAVWCREVADSLQLPRADREILDGAALLHQFPDLISDDRARRSLLAELKVAESEPSPEELSPEMLELLQVFHRRGGQPDARISKLAAVLEMCDGFDEAFEIDALAPGLTSDEVLSSATEVRWWRRIRSSPATLSNAPTQPCTAERAGFPRCGTLWPGLGPITRVKWWLRRH